MADALTPDAAEFCTTFGLKSARQVGNSLHLCADEYWLLAGRFGGRSVDSMEPEIKTFLDNRKGFEIYMETPR